MPSGLTHSSTRAPLCCPVQGRGSLFQALQPVRDWASSPALIPLMLAHPCPLPSGTIPLCCPGELLVSQLQQGARGKEGRASPYTHAHLIANRCQDQLLPSSHPQGRLSPWPQHQGQLHRADQERCNSQRGAGQVLHSPWASTWSQAAAQIRDVQMIFSGNMNHRH